MTDSRSSIGNRARSWIAAGSALILAIVIGCGGSGSGGGSITGTSATTNTTTGLTTTATAGTTTTGSVIPPGTLPSNVIFYGDGGSQALSGTSYDLYYVSPTGTGNALFVTVPSNVSAACANPSVTGQFVFAATADGTNYGIYSNSSLSTTGAKTIVQPTLLGPDAVTVTPDGNYVIYSAQDANSNQAIYRVQISGGVSTELYNGDDPEVDPTNKFITYDAFDPVTTNEYIWMSKIDGSSPTQLTSGPSAFDYYPQFSKQSDRIAFNREDDTATGITDIYTYTIATQTLTQITTSTDTSVAGLFNTGPSWSPDGTMLSFYSEPVNNSVNSAPSGVFTGSSTPSAPYVPTAVAATSTTPAQPIVTVAAAETETYWTGSSGRSAGGLKAFEFRRKHTRNMHRKSK